MGDSSKNPSTNTSSKNKKNANSSGPSENTLNKPQNDKVGGAKDMLHGFIYQNQMALYYIIRCLNIASEIEDFSFELSTELKSAGKFDDLIFRYGTSEEQKYRLVQIKHKISTNEQEAQKPKSKNISIANLFWNTKDQFRLAQYFASYLQIKNDFAESAQRFQRVAYKNDPVEYFVITTNASFEPDLFNEMFEPIQDPILEKLTLYQFKSSFLSKTISDLKNFDPEKWYLPMTKKFPENTKMIDSILHDPYVMKLPFEKDIALDSFFRLLTFSCNNPDGLLIEKVIKDEIKKYYKWKISEEVINTAYTSILKQDIFDWVADRDITTIYMSDAVNIFAEIVNKNLYLISNDFKTRVVNISQIEFRPESNLYDQFLNGPKKILNILATTGTRMSLLKLIQFTTNEKIVFVSDRIISRYKDHLICALCLKTIDFLVIECRLQKATSEIKSILEEIKNSKKDTTKIILISTTETYFSTEMKNSDIFEEIYESNEFCDLTEKSQKIIMDEYVIFQGYDVQLSEIMDESSGVIIKNKVLCQLLSNKDVFIGETIKSDIDTDEHYIDRRLINQNFTSEIVVDNLFVIDEKIVLISSEPGMGKSSLLKHLAYSTKVLDNSAWIVLLQLNNFTEYFNKQTDFTSNEALELLLTVQCFREDFEKNLFRTCICNELNKIIILIDGFDEISVSYRQKVLNFITLLKNTNVKSIWITTRPQEKQLLESAFNVQAYLISPFSKEEQEQFLIKFWKKDMNDNRASLYVNKLLRTTKEAITDYERRLTGIPLMIKMLAQTYSEQFNDFYENDCEIVDVFQPYDILKLYENFIENKFDDYLIQKLNIDYTKSGIEDIKELVRVDFINNHKLLSIYILFKHDLEHLLDEEQINKLEILQYKIITGGGNFGIVYSGNNQLTFKHRTFAEYFAAKWFVDNCISNEKVNKYLNVHMFDPEMEVVRQFFDYMSATHDIHRTILQNDLTVTEKLLNDETMIDAVDKFGRTPLHLIASHNCKHIASIYLTKYINSLHKEDRLFQWNPLQYACIAKSWDFLDFCIQKNLFDIDLLDLIDVKSSMNEVELNGCFNLLKLFQDKLAKNTDTIHKNDVRLHSAIILDQIDNFESLLKSYPNLVNSTDFDNCTPLYYAITKNYINIVQLLLNNYADINHCNKMNTTPLILASEKGNLEIVKLLIDNNTNLNQRDNRKMTPLLAAVLSGNMEIVEYLIEKGAKINLIDLNQSQVLINATLKGHLEVLKYLHSLGIDIINWTNVGDKWTLLHFAACDGNTKIIEYLCEKGAEVNAESNDKESPLYISARHNDLNNIEILIKYGADINVRSISSFTPLHFATVHGHLNVVDYFIQRGINRNARTVGQKTALHLAAILNLTDIVNYLIDAKLEIDARDEKNKTPLIYAAENGRLESLKILFEKGTQNKTEFNETALITASSKGHLEIVTFLIESGININSLDVNQRTCLHHAVINSHLNVIKYLMEKGAYIHALDCNDCTPLDIAVQNEYTDIIEYLNNINIDNNNLNRNNDELMLSNENNTENVL